MADLRVAFAGTPQFAALALQALLDARLTVPLVLTQPDRPAGRGLKLQASAVKQLAQARGLPVLQPQGLRLDGRWAEEARHAYDALAAARPDVMVVAAYGLILPAWVLDMPRLGCLNIHASLLPRWRGAAPIHRAIQAGDAETGVTIMQMDPGLDTGPMLLGERLAIEPRETTGSLHDRLGLMGARLIVQALDLAAHGGLRPQAQPTEGVTYAHKIEKHEAPLDWLGGAAGLDRCIRAFNPFPGAHFGSGPETIKVWQAMPLVGTDLPGSDVPGTVVAIDHDGVDVACGEGVLRLVELQRPSARRQPAWLVAQALDLKVGDRLT